MGIEDIQISEELETNAPSIKYTGDEGPKSPEQIEQMMMAQLEEEYLKYVDEMIEMGREPMSMQQFMEQAMAEGQMAGGNPLPQDPTKPVNPFQPKPTGPVLPDRQMAAYGGIMGMDGRRQYGIGSSLKKGLRKLIPNELASIAVKAAPFVAPFNPLAAGLMSGIGSFDQTGRIGSSLKSGLMNYGLGQASRYLGGADFQKGINPFKGPNYGFSMPTGEGGIKNLFKDKAPVDKAVDVDSYLNSLSVDDKTTMMKEYFENDALMNKYSPTEYARHKASMNILTDKGKNKIINEGLLGDIKGKIMEYVPTSLGELNPLGPNFDMKKAIGAGGIFATAVKLFGEPDDVVGQIMDRGEGLDLVAIRTEVQEAFKDPSGDKLAALRVKYPFLGRADTKDMSAMAMGGRIGKAEGGIMDLGGMEKDYRAEGGFVPIGREEKADDVPARLSVNEFVFTADAVRNAGGGDIDKGAEVMENMMKHLEQGGQVSDESQGMAGAQQMFETSERLSEVI
jgi:hypothetical protein